AVDKTLDAAAVAAAGVPAGAERVLFKTRNSQLWEQDEFSEDFVSFDASGARALLGADVAVVEGLDLRAAEPGPYQLVCLPLKLVGSDGGPARAVLLRTT